MTDRYDAIAVRTYERNGEQKSAFTNIGVAFPMKDKDGFRIMLHCIPVAGDKGECTILLMPPKEREEAPRTRQGAPLKLTSPASRPLADELDDSIPFLPETR